MYTARPAERSTSAFFYALICLIEDSILPVHKVSAIRGGMGEMLLRANCISDRACSSCDFEAECIVRRTMYSKFAIVSIKNTDFQDILSGNDIIMANYQVRAVSQYVTHRMEKITGAEKTLAFYTPASLKYNGEFSREFSIDAILAAVKRRIYMLNCFEGIENDFYHICQAPVPKVSGQQHKHIKVPRHSSRKEPMLLHGIIGFVQLEDIHPDTLMLLLAGELIHIGKNTSFGFGRYQVV